MSYAFRTLGFIFSAVAFIAALTKVALAATDLPLNFPDPFNGDPVPSIVKSWIRLTIQGSRDHPYTIVWISPQGFKRRSFEKLIVLTPDEYRSFLNFARAQDCSDRGELSGQARFRITEFSDSRGEMNCFMSRKTACAFLTNVRTLPNSGWTPELFGPISDLVYDIP